MKIIFDENLSEYSVGHLRSFFQSHKPPRPLFAHIREYGAGGKPDDEWIPEVMRQEAILVTGDLGGSAPRLPQICRENKKTHILMSGTIRDASNFVILRAIVVLWPKICEAWQGEKGVRYFIGAYQDVHHFTWTRK